MCNLFPYVIRIILSIIFIILFFKKEGRGKSVLFYIPACALTSKSSSDDIKMRLHDTTL